MTEPDAIAAIRDRLTKLNEFPSQMRYADFVDNAESDIAYLLAEVDRLREALHNIDAMSAHMVRQEMNGGAACDREDVEQLGDMARAALAGKEGS